MRLFSLLWWIITKSLKVKSIWMFITCVCVYCPFNTHTQICVCVCVYRMQFVQFNVKKNSEDYWVGNLSWKCCTNMYLAVTHFRAELWTVTSSIERLHSAVTNRNKRELLRHCVYIKCIFGILHFMLHSLWVMSLLCL